VEIRELNLIAFGPFSNRLLDFSSSGGGLHIVYGPNEAGKSSSLRGLKALLFGIPARTTDNFRHEHKDLRIGGILRSRDGYELAIVRRKGNKNTLMSPDGGQIADDALVPYLHGVSAEVFEMLFGVDHEALVRGGQEILEQKGEVGQALFSASMGSAALHAVLEQLDTEAGELFKPGGSKPAINAALREFAQLQKAMKDQSLSSREWSETCKALERTNKELEKVQAGLLQCKAQRNRLQRIQRAMPRISARRERLQKIADLGDVVVLAADFGKRRETATRELDKSITTANGATRTLESLQKQLAAVSVNAEILGLGEAIEGLHARSGGYCDAMQDRPGLEAERSQLLTDAEALLKAVRPDLSLADVEKLRPVLSKIARITNLGNRRQALIEGERQAVKLQREHESRLQKAREERAELAEAGSPDALRKQITLARRQGDLDESLRTARDKYEALEQACRNDLSRLGTLWQGTFEAIPGLPLPPRESIDRFEQAYADLAGRIRHLGDRQAEQANRVRDAQQQLDEIRYAGSLPTEQDLLDLRSGRQQAWELIRRQWLDGETVDTEARALDPERALPEAYEFRVIGADEVADRLRREAERVQKRANLLATLADARARTEELAGEFEACAGEQRQIDADWARLWERSGIRSLPPREMRACLDNMERLRNRVEDLHGQQRQLDSLEQMRESHIQSLQQALKDLGQETGTLESLEALLVECETVADRINELARQRQILNKEILDLEQRLESSRLEQRLANEALQIWKAEWQGLISGLGLGADALPAEVAAILDSVRNIFEKQNQATKLQIRIAAIDAAARKFREDVARVVAVAAPDIAKVPAEDAVARLIRLLGDAQREDSRRQQIEKQIRSAREDIDTAEATRKTMLEKIDALCKEAKCRDASELELTERKSDESQNFKHAIDGLEQELRDIAEGVTLAELEAQVDAANPDTLPVEIEVLKTRIDEELEPQIKELHEAKGRQQNELDRMDGSDAAAALADEAQSVLVTIRSNAEQYVRAKLASRILRNEIEHYRQQHQGPLLERASEHFTVLTRGSFAGLRADFNEKDEPVLVGMRPNDERVHVEGMSSGTRDQLYLALRLASLEKYMDSAEPMPFIVDDILVHFDDDRAQATLGVLAELAQRTQMILFTHHARLVEQARALNTTVPVTVHAL
jgi:uncharacterized protein YhaN